ncbi:MAG: Hsp20/alpha crystallin family protein [Lachnospiraceae bacterium]|nr:Hsp20/alpha crystallin family protein [Lachnospiraceae bacterium]
MLMPSIFGESLFDDFFEDFARPIRSVAKINNPVGNVMRTDVKECDNGYQLDIDLPGYDKKDVQAKLKDGYLTITASTKDEKKDESDGKYIRRERYYGTCSRRFYVGEHMELEDIKAKFENGILRVTIPKKEAKPQIEKDMFINIEG